MSVYLVNDARVDKVLLIEVHKAKLLPGPLGGVEDVGDAEPGEQPRVLRRPPVPDKEAGTDLTMIIMILMCDIIILRTQQPTQALFLSLEMILVMMIQTDLVTIAAPGLSVEGGEQSPVLGTLPRPHLPAHGE